MATQNELNQKIDQLTQTLATEVEQIKAAIEAKVPPEVDLSAEIARLEGLNTAIASIVADEPTDTPAEPVTPADEVI